MAVEKSPTQPVTTNKTTRQQLAALKAPLYTLTLLLVALAAFGVVYVAYNDAVVDKIMFGVGPFEIIFTGIALVLIYMAYQRF